jgi:hypothetical protein
VLLAEGTNIFAGNSVDLGVPSAIIAAGQVF